MSADKIGFRLSVWLSIIVISCIASEKMTLVKLLACIECRFCEIGMVNASRSQIFFYIDKIIKSDRAQKVRVVHQLHISHEHHKFLYNRTVCL